MASLCRPPKALSEKINPVQISLLADFWVKVDITQCKHQYTNFQKYTLE